MHRAIESSGNETKSEAHSQQLLMKDNRESKMLAGRVTDAEIASAIRYLDPEYPNNERTADTVLMICFSLIALLGGALGCILLYLRTS